MRQENRFYAKNSRENSLKTLIIPILSIILFVYALFQWKTIFTGFQWLIKVLSPFFAGIAIAFIFNIPVTWLEKKLSSHFSPSSRKSRHTIRIISIFLTLAVAAALFAALLFLLIPQLIRSVTAITEKAPIYAKQIQLWINELMNRVPFLKETMEALFGTTAWQELDWFGMVSGFTDFTAAFMNTLGSVILGISSGIFRFLFSLLFSIYMLLQKEALIINIRRVLYAFLPWKTAAKIIHLGQLANQIFSGFISGQCTEAFILGLLCFLGMGILGLPYSALISVFVALTSLIPVFGAYFGAVFGCLLLFLSKPWDSVIFLIFFILLQNIEGNFIYPKVVGNSVGLPGLWVMFSILIFGDLFGFLGMLIGVPVCSLLYRILKESTHHRLKKKHINPKEAAQGCVGVRSNVPQTKLVQVESKTKFSKP